ncbi:hypothetical protein LJR232_005009 [Aquipseudomonas alcaligenes]
MSIVLAFVAAIAVAGYWTLCRRVSLKHRNAVADLLEPYMSNEGAKWADREAIYATYRMARHWFFLPVMVLGVPIFLLAIILANKEEDLSPKRRLGEHSLIMDSIMKMYVTRHPITSTVCLSIIFLSISIFVPMGLLLNRIKSIPSLPMIFSAVAGKAPHPHRDAHAH